MQENCRKTKEELLTLFPCREEFSEKKRVLLGGGDLEDGSAVGIHWAGRERRQVSTLLTFRSRGGGLRH